MEDDDDAAAVICGSFAFFSPSNSVFWREKEKDSLYISTRSKAEKFCGFYLLSCSGHQC